MKSKYLTLILVVVLLIGLGLLAYPGIAQMWNKYVASHVVENYEKYVADMDEENYSSVLAQAQDYNNRLSAKDAPLNQYDEVEGYREALNVDDSSVMGVLRINSIDVNLPIYHGTSSTVLSDGVGHMEGTGLPIGGEGNHAVLSAHRGLPGSRLFTDLDKVVVGDVFTLTVLNETLTYEIDKINIALPEETQYLLPVQGEDYCTLVTCTPYGVNTHRLLVRGRRIDNIDESTLRIINEASVFDKWVVTAVIAVPIVILLFGITAFFDKRNRNYGIYR